MCATPPKVFMPIVLILYRCFSHGLKMCICFGYNPQIIFVTFSHKLSLVALRHLLLSIYECA